VVVVGRGLSIFSPDPKGIVDNRTDESDQGNDDEDVFNGKIEERFHGFVSPREWRVEKKSGRDYTALIVTGTVSGYTLNRHLCQCSSGYFP
jgi:hypothetical protein